MQILVIAQIYAPDSGGSSTRAVNVVKGLLARGHEVSVIAGFPHYPNGARPAAYKWKLISVQNQGSLSITRCWVPGIASRGLLNRLLLFTIFSITSLFALGLLKRPNVVWAGNPTTFSFFPGFVFSRAYRCPIVRNADDLWPETVWELGLIQSHLLFLVAEFLSKLSYRLADAVTPISAGYVDRIANHYGVSRELIQVVEVGLDLNTVEVEVPQLELTQHSFTVLYSGTLGRGYSFRTILEASRLLLDHPEIKVIIRGAGELADSIRSQASKLKLKNITLRLGWINQQDLSSIMSSADAFLLPMPALPFVDSGLPTKVFEYQAMGKPIICCSSGESAEYVSNTQCGVVVPAVNPAALAKAILELSTDRERCESMGDMGRKSVREYSTIKIGEKMERVFMQVMSSRKLNPR